MCTKPKKKSNKTSNLLCKVEINKIIHNRNLKGIKRKTMENATIIKAS